MNIKEAELKAKEINLRVLKRKYPDIEDIIYTCKHSNLYEFDKAAKVWHKLSMSGPLFFCLLQNKAGTRLVIMNQCENKDFETDNISPKWTEYNKSQKMVYFKASDGYIRGIWVNDEHSLDNLYQLLTNQIKPVYRVY